MKGTAILLCVSSLLACSSSHGPNAGTSGSNWLQCVRLADCAEAEEAVACSPQGFCIDDDGERIARDRDQAGPSAAAGSAAPATGCFWGTNSLLETLTAEHEVDARTSCGSYLADDRTGVTGGMTCFDSAVARGQAVELTIEECTDCGITRTYVSASSGLVYMITRENGQRGDDVAQVRFDHCQEGVVLDPGTARVVCQNLRQLYRCNQALNEPTRDEPEPPTPITPLQLGNVSAAGSIERETLHLYVRNQASLHDLVGIDVYIDDVHVVTGDFYVGGQHDWVEFTILVPSGTHTFRATLRKYDTSLEETIGLPAERWAVLDYWDDGSPATRMLTFSVHDEPVVSNGAVTVNHEQAGTP